MFSMRFLPVLATILVHCCGHPLLEIQQESSSVVLPPSQDPFYSPPSDISGYGLGEIIRSRPPPGPLSGIAQYTAESVKGAYQLMFRTTNTVGDPAAAITTVIIPYNANYSRVLFYPWPYDSSDVVCSPSIVLQQHANSSDITDILSMAAALNNGWVVATPDFEGLNAAFVAGVGSGQAVLDSVRATLASGSITGVDTDATYALWGYSGGALGSEWALELQPLYAPELHFAGAALGGLTPNATTVLEYVNGGPAAALVFNGINGLMAGYPNLTDFVNANIYPSMKSLFTSTDTACANNSAPSLVLQNAFDYFPQGQRILYDPVVQSVLNWGAVMGRRSTPQSPLFAYKAIADEVSPITDTDALVAGYCERGVSIQYQKNTVGEHLSEEVTGAAAALAWLKDRFNGVPVEPGCSTQIVTVSGLSSSDIEETGVLIASALDLLLQQRLGGSSDSTPGISVSVSGSVSIA